ncbi:hypothetical protein O7543_21805 [Solwaraspora sp. WMMA2080]|uniref:hypothetical protein n=1 Tax=unclassified Solwaraspora TaxID=2627926 RepID=UPI00248C86E9|nr:MULTISPECIES: hypothetical protein [unclassified Solwaraspora]WBB96626.1 hypothetical protein O7553_25565 [Solwaraspora sp. WMMA2059]WBC19470.1 hypothetical protein O7543_21805 [Solwaraspora sp. WMMA2080]
MSATVAAISDPRSDQRGARRVRLRGARRVRLRGARRVRLRGARRVRLRGSTAHPCTAVRSA